MGAVSEQHDVRAFLRWAGGKQRLASALVDLAPPSHSYDRYFEPFLGGGSLFFALRPYGAVLGDINADLVNCYRQIQTGVEDVIRKVGRYVRRDSREFYNRIRKTPPPALSPAGRAAWFIYLNKAAFNGLYRVNSAGQFNVPYGPSPGGPAVPSRTELRAVAESLAVAEIRQGDFEATIRDAGHTDFVYLDPPYPPRSATGFFTHYTSTQFTWEDQERVARVLRELSMRGCKVMLSNSGQKRVIALYKGFHVRRLNVVRWLGSNGDRFKVHEIIVTNYDVDTGRKDV